VEQIAGILKGRNLNELRITSSNPNFLELNHLHQVLNALVNQHVHYDTSQAPLPEAERQAGITLITTLIEEQMAQTIPSASISAFNDFVGGMHE
jgi:hypothetical protein